MAKIWAPCGSPTKSTPLGPNARAPADLRSGLPFWSRPAGAAFAAAVRASTINGRQNRNTRDIIASSPGMEKERAERQFNWRYLLTGEPGPGFAAEQRKPVAV